MAIAARGNKGGSGGEVSTPANAARERVRSSSLRQLVREHRRLFGLLLAAVLITAFAVAVLPQITSVGTTLRRLGHGNLAWLLVGVALECISIGGYILLFRTVFSCHGTVIGWRASYEITLAGVVATKLLAAAGAGGIALTAWALRASGLSGRMIARRMAGFEILLYAVFMVALVVVGAGLGTGIMGSAPWTVSYLPGAFGGVVILLALLFALVPSDALRLSPRSQEGSSRLAGLARRLQTVPATIGGGLRTAVSLIRERNPGIAGAIVYWAFDIATLWVCFRAFGYSAPVAVVIMGYYVGQLANAIPLPGGIGGVEGGMIGCFIALHVNAGAAIVAVFAYRAISFWLPTLPGAAAYVQLRHRIAGWREDEDPAEESAGAGAAAGAGVG